MIGKILAVAKGGSGIVRDGEKTVFVPGVIAGETVEYTLLGRRRSAWQGRLQRVLEPSPQRTRPPCPHYGECGGCNLQHMSYDEQLRTKAEILGGNLKKIAGIEPAAATEILPSPPWRYRSKSEFQLRGGAAGFFARESHRVVTVSRCPLIPEVAEAFFLDRRPGLAGHGDSQLQVVSNGRELAARLEAAAGGETWLSRERTVQFQLGPYAYRVGPENFIQANLFQLRPMLDLLEAALDGMPITSAADLYCGCGFFTLPLAARCRTVLALENDPRNVACLRANLESNHAGHVQVIQADVLRSGLPQADVLVADPPRGGLSARVIAAMAGGPARAVIYFSCDSATFARDLRLFIRHGFALDAMRLVDNFPHSDHFEIFSVLKKRSTD